MGFDDDRKPPAKLYHDVVDSRKSSDTCIQPTLKRAGTTHISRPYAMGRDISNVHLPLKRYNGNDEATAGPTTFYSTKSVARIPDQSLEDESLNGEPSFIRTSSGSTYDTRDESFLREQRQMMLGYSTTTPVMFRTASGVYNSNDPKTLEQQEMILAQIRHKTFAPAAAVGTATATRPSCTSSLLSEMSPFYLSALMSSSESSPSDVLAEVNKNQAGKMDGQALQQKMNIPTSDFIKSGVHPTLAGKNVRIRRSGRSMEQAIADRNAMAVQCYECLECSLVQKDAKVLYCPLCFSLSPIDSTQWENDKGEGTANQDESIETVVARKLDRYRRNLDR